MTTEQEKEIREHIKLLIETYQIEGERMSIPELINLRTQLVTWNASLSTVVSRRRRDSQLAYVFRRYMVAHSKNSLIKNSMSIGQADAQSIVDNKTSYDNEVEKENEAFETDLLWRSVNKIDDAIAQQVSWMKTEELKSRNT